MSGSEETKITKKFQSHHIGLPDKILEASCKTVGLPLNDILKILTDRSEDFDGLTSISVGDWYYICSLLHLEMGCISYGYFSYLHRRGIGEAVYNGNYRLPMTTEVKEILKSYKVEMKNQRKDELKYYGGKLKRKVRLGYLKSDLQSFISRLGKMSYRKRFRG